MHLDPASNESGSLQDPSPLKNQPATQDISQTSETAKQIALDFCTWKDTHRQGLQESPATTCFVWQFSVQISASNSWIGAKILQDVQVTDKNLSYQ